MLRILLLLCSLFFLASTTNAQAYRTAAGLRLASGKTIGMTIQQKLIDNYTLEAIFQVRPGNTGLSSIILLGEQHQKILFKRLNLYFGLGFHKGWYNASNEIEESNPSGLATIAGLELALGRMALSLDIQPNLNIWGGDQFVQSTTGVSIRYILVKRKKKKVNWKFWKKK